MAISSYLTPEILDELVWALRITLNRVESEEIVNPEEAQLWRTAREWLDEAEHALEEPDEAKYLTRLSRFPLSGAQLRRLQQTVDRLAAEREPDQSSPFQRLMALPILTARGLVRESWYHARKSSFIIAGVLVLSLVVTILVTVLDSTIWRNIPWQLLAVADVSLTLVALVVWFLHHLDLREHHQALVGLRLFEKK